MAERIVKVMLCPQCGRTLEVCWGTTGFMPKTHAERLVASVSRRVREIDLAALSGPLQIEVAMDNGARAMLVGLSGLLREGIGKPTKGQGKKGTAAIRRAIIRRNHNGRDVGE